MNKSRILAHLGLSLVTYVPLVVTIVQTAELFTAEELFTFGALVYMILATTMMMFVGWWYVYLFIAISLIISIPGLIKKENFAINIITFLICVAWIAGYWAVRLV